jgi:tetracycline repressor-like protein
MAGRRPDLQSEIVRWAEALDTFLAPHIADPTTRAGATAAIDGLFLRAFSTPDPPNADEVHAILLRLAAG